MLNRRQALASFAATAAVSPALAAAAPERIDRIKVLSFNILAGGARLGPIEQTAKLIRESGADLVGLQEVKESGPKLVELTGLHRLDQGGGSTQILSRWPIAEPSVSKWGARIDVPGRGPVWLFNAHLPAAPYQPYQLARIPYGKDNPFITTEAEAIAEAKRARGEHVARLVKDMAPAIGSGDPVLLTGDFNEPSHLDWTARAAKARRCALPVAWPTSRAITDAGLADAYRAVHRDELERPGHTWTPTPAKRDVPDRIDLIYARGLAPTAAAVIGESRENADVVIDPYPSDHRAVLVTARFE